MFERIKRAIGRQPLLTDPMVNTQTRVTDLGPIARFLRGFDLSDDSGSGVRLTNPYMQHVAVFRCINIITTLLASVPFKIMSTGKEIQSGDVYNIIHHPNDVMDWKDLISTFLTDYLVGGNGYLIIDYNGSKPGRLLPIPWYKMSAILAENDEFKIAKWEKDNGAQHDPTPLDPDNVINLLYAPSTSSRVIGVGPLVSAKIIAEADYAAMWYNLSILNGGGLPSGILAYKGPGRLTEEMRNEVKDSWRRTFGGPKAGSRLAVINQDWSWQATGASKADMESTQGRDYNLGDICRAFNVPKLYLLELPKGASGSNTTTTELKMFYYNNLIPLARRIEDKLNYKLFPLYGKNITCEFDFEAVESLKEDFNNKVVTAKTLVQMGFSPNSVSRIMNLGMDKMPWGDDYLAPMNLVPAQDIVDHAVVPPSGPADKMTGIGSDQISNAEEQATPKDNPSQEKPAKAPAKKAALYEQAPRALLSAKWNVDTSPLNEIGDRCVGMTRRNLLSDRSKILSGESTGLNSAGFADGIIPFLINSFTEGYASIHIAEQTALYQRAAIYADSRYEELVSFCDSLSELIRNKPLGIDADRFRRKLMNRITRKIGESCKTEIFRAFNSGRFLAVTDKHTEKCLWVAAPGSDCADAINNGDIRLVGDTFSTGHRYPGDYAVPATVGCDCIISAFKDETL